jgi:hypothetical protein
MEFSEYIAYLFNFFLGIAAVLAFIMIFTAGIKLLESRGNPSQIEEAKKKIINSLIGLTILLTSYILLTTINPDIINVQNINLGGVNISVPVIIPNPKPETIKNYSFEEIPIGTITEAILAGTSSTVNVLPCYEYEHKAYDDDDNLIIGNTIDQNGDGKINEKDIILDKDPFYCIKLLDDAIKKKIEIHLNKYIAGTNQLDDLMKKGCDCRRSYRSSFSPYYPAEGIVERGGPDCYCPQGTSYCNCCGSREGCVRAPFNPYKITAGDFKQYTYDVCGNRLKLDCKRQEIRELMNGTKPDQICYDEEYIEEEAPFNLLTIAEAIKRLNAFKSYYDDQVGALESAEMKMKDPYDEKLSLAEMYNNVETRENSSVIKNSFGIYNIARYCRESNCTYDEDNKIQTCTLSKESRVCRLDEEEGDQEYYTYAGDGATFYYSKEYNEDLKGENRAIDQSDNKCSIEEQDMSNEMYGGLIRIGETVDYSEAWGKEVSKRIDNLKKEVEGMYNTGMLIYDFPDECDSNNCTNYSPNKNNVCTKPSCCRDCGEGCNCYSVSIRGCQTCEPVETICAVKEVGGSCPEKEMMSYAGCSSCCGGCPDVEVHQKDYWACPYRDLYGLIKSLYQRRTIDTFCYEETENEAEKGLRASNLGQVGYVQKMEERERLLFELASVGVIKEVEDEDYEPYENVPTTNLFASVFSDAQYLIPDSYADLECNAELSFKNNIENRFVLFDMLNEARERLNGCVKGYSIPHKENADNVRVMSCYEVSNTILVILPEFPYPNKNNNDPPYINCYPYNSNELTVKEKEICFYNINRTGVESDPGCLLITKEYMDNYYCCQ